jgi:hypothetical protein
LTVPDARTGEASAPPSFRVLNLGSGNKPLEGALNLDVSPATRPDVVHDLNQVPWPFKDDAFDEVHGYDVLEHVDNVVTFMQEVHRISRDGALTKLTVPHFSSANTWRDPTHQHGFAHGSLDYFVEGHALSHYSSARFVRVHSRLIFHSSLLNRLIDRLANRWPERYEDRWCWIFPAWFLYFELRVVKGGRR